jgi:hypothetical protein
MMLEGTYEGDLRARYLEARVRLGVPSAPRVQVERVALHEKPVKRIVLEPPRARDWLSVSDHLHLEKGAEIAVQRRMLSTDQLWMRIATEVGRSHGVSLKQMQSHRRDKRFVRARQEAMYRMKTETLMSFPAIGRKFNRDHTTVLYSIRKYEERMRAAQQ